VARVVFTAHLAQVGPREEERVSGPTVIAVLDEIFARYPRLEGYVLDDQRRLRRHVVIFIDGARVPPEAVLQRAVDADSEIYVLQALSGG
jgi:molybdopterin converting factor small subunit